MMVTTGGRAARSSGLSSVSEMNSSSSNPTFSTFQPWSMASRLAVSKSMGWFCVTIFPAAISLRIRSALFTPMVCDSSATVMVSSIRITFLCSDISVISVCFPFFALFFLWPRTGTYARCRASSTRSCLEIDSVFSTRGPFFPRCGAPLLSLVTSMNSRPRPGPPETTASSRTSPTGRGRNPPPAGGRGAGRAMGISGRERTTARVADGRIWRFSVTCTDWTPPGPWTMGPVALAGGGRTCGLGGGGGAGRAATLATPAGSGFPLPGGHGGQPRGGGGWGRCFRGWRRRRCRGDHGGRRLRPGLGRRDSRRLRLADLDGRARGRFRDDGSLGGERGRVLVFCGGVRLLPAQHYAAAGRLGRLYLRAFLPLELLHYRKSLVVLERGRVTLDVVLVSAQPVDHLLVGEAEVLRELVHALLRHPVLNPFQKTPPRLRGASSLVCCLRRRQAKRGPSTRGGGQASAPPPSL